MFYLPPPPKIYTLGKMCWNVEEYNALHNPIFPIF
jgi:hypothetical protein